MLGFIFLFFLFIVVCITKSYFSVPKHIRLISAQYFILKVPIIMNSNNHSSDIHYEDFMNLYKKCIAKPYSFSVIDTTLASDHSLRFRKNLLEIISKIIMTIHNKIRDEERQYDINEEPKKSALSSFNIDKYEYHTGEGITPSDQSRTKEQS